MKALPLTILAFLIVAFLSSDVFAQEPGAMIDAKNVEQDKALAERAEIDAIIGGEIISLKTADEDLSSRLDDMAVEIEALAARVEALEGGPIDPPDPPDPTDPDPVEPPVEPSLPLYLITESGEKGPRILGDITIEGKFSLCAFAEDGVRGPVKFFRYETLDRSEGQSAYCLFGGNEAPFPVDEWFPGDHPVRVEADGVAPFSFNVKINGPTGPPPVTGPSRLQVGLWFPSTFNLEDPFVNFIHPSSSFWEGGGMTTPALIEKGYLDARTGLPTGKPGLALQTGGYFEVGAAGEYMPLRDGCWVFEIEGATATLKARELSPSDQKQTAPNRLEFCRDAAGGKTPYRERFTLSNISGPVTDIRLYRKEHEPLIRAGQLYNPDLIEAVKGYDIIRMMDMQSANMAVVTSVDQLATMDAPFYGNADGSNATGEPWMRYENTYQGMPLEAVFRLGTESGKSIWFQAPITLGAPGRYFDYRPDDDRYDKWATAFAQAARAQAPAVIESEEWDRYADAFVDALIASGYPEDRELIVSLANEVWNWSGQYWLTTKYALETGQGLSDYLGLPSGIRESYGAFLARFKLALDAALERKGRTQTITYAIEGQAAWVELTGAAIRGAKAYIEKKGETWTDHAPGFGVSVASYWATNGDLEQTGIDFHDAAALENLLLNGPDNILGTRANVVKLFRGAKAQGAQYGVRLIGAYEGGPHFGRPWLPDENGGRNYLMTEQEYRDFLWGDPGARINKAINAALAAEFPGIILSNYALAGAPYGQPWFEGPIGCNSPYCLSWTE